LLLIIFKFIFFKFNFFFFKKKKWYGIFYISSIIGLSVAFLDIIFLEEKFKKKKIKKIKKKIKIENEENSFQLKDKIDLEIDKKIDFVENKIKQIIEKGIEQEEKKEEKQTQPEHFLDNKTKLEAFWFFLTCKELYLMIIFWQLMIFITEVFYFLKKKI
jgi:hypothetical protein